MKILGFGDYLMRLNTLDNQRFLQATEMKINFTGAEANVIAALSLWGLDTSFVTRLPENDLAKHGIMFMQSFGTDTSSISRGGKRMGLYFIENGASLRPSAVVYDRYNSSFTEAAVSDFDFDKMLLGVDMIVLSGITPVLSENLFECAKVLLKKAKEKNIDVIYDVNYRATLGTFEKSAEILKALAPYITVLITNEEHAKMLLGVSSEYGEFSRKERLFDIATQIKNILGIEKIAVTVRRTLSASDNKVSSAFLCGDEFVISPEYTVHIVDRVGSGDAFCAGLAFGLASGFSATETVNFAEASCALKHTVEKDINFVSKEEILRLCTSNGADVKR